MSGCKDYITFRYGQKFESYFPHFKPTEFKCGCKGKYCKGYPVKLDFDLLDGLERVREHFGKPVIVTSGLRCTKYNSIIPGSVKNSFHRKGKAADIVITGVDPDKIVQYWQSLGLGYTYCGTKNMGNAAHVQIGW